VTRRNPELAVLRLAGTHMTVRQLAEKCIVGENVIRQACQEGRVAAVKHGRSWFIPVLDGEIYARAYFKANSGSTWQPDVARRARGFRDTNPTKAQQLRFDLPARTLRLIDAERKHRAAYPSLDKRRNGRASIIIEAIEKWLGEEYWV